MWNAFEISEDVIEVHRDLLPMIHSGGTNIKCAMIYLHAFYTFASPFLAICLKHEGLATRAFLS